MLPTVSSASDKPLEKSPQDSPQMDLEEVSTKLKTGYKRLMPYAVVIIIITSILVGGVVCSIYVYGKYAKKDTEIVYRQFEDDGVKHSTEIETNKADRVETVVFEKIDNVTDGGTLMFDFKQKLVAAYSDKDDACYLWADDSLDWDDRDWLYEGDSPSFFFTKEDEIPSQFLRRVVDNEISNKCFGVKTYWAVLAAENDMPSGEVETTEEVETAEEVETSEEVESTEVGHARNRRGLYCYWRFRCSCWWRRCRCYYYRYCRWVWG